MVCEQIADVYHPLNLSGSEPFRALIRTFAAGALHHIESADTLVGETSEEAGKGE